MRALLSLIAAGALLALGACAATTGPDVAPKLASTLDTVQAGFNAAAIVADVYAALPSCLDDGHPAVCSKPEVVVEIRKAMTVASAAIEAARNTVQVAAGGSTEATAIAAAVNSVLALQTIVRALDGAR